jgi:hypothetical protein
MLSLTEKFQQAYLSMDTNLLSECISDNIYYSAWPSANKFKVKENVVLHFTEVFQFLNEHNAVSEKSISNDKTFFITYSFFSLRPVSQYLINPDGIFLVVCLEKYFNSMRIEVSYKVRNQKIIKIQIFQARK